MSYKELIVKENGNYTSYLKPGYELDLFEIIPVGSTGNYSVKVPLRLADCIYTTKFTNLDDARRFIDYHLQAYLSTS